MSHTYVTHAWSCSVRLVVGDPVALAPAGRDLQTLLARIDSLASRFRADSALSQANAHAGRTVPVPRLLAAMVGAALDAAEQTGGAVDPTLGRQLARLGYDHDINELPLVGPAVAQLPVVASWRDVRLLRESGLLLVPAGVALDLGATAKAYTADLAARTLHRLYGTDVLVEIGGDLAVTGERSGGWPVEVAERERTSGQLVVLHGGGLATSTTTLRRWTRGGQPMHHILDPLSGLPAAGPWRTVSVHAPTALAANTASTAAIVLGDRALTWLRERAFAARLVHRDGSVVTTPGWPVAHRAAA